MLIETDYRAMISAGQEGLPLAACDAVVAIGNFDGVHHGHRQLLRDARRIADENGWMLTVLTFDPHPRLYFKPDQKPFLLTDKVQKQEELLAAGVDAIVSLRFDAILADLSANEFIEHVLGESLRARHIVVGDNFMFGKNRGGNIETLKNKGFGVSALTAIKDVTGQVISSERIRGELRHGHTASAEDLLGRPWQLRGVVVRGNQIGRQWGFPTANVEMGEYLPPQFGVYAGTVSFEGMEGVFNAAISIGVRPSIGSFGPIVEAYLLDFSGDLYGKTMRVNLLQFLRPEKKFIDLNELKDQIAHDVRQIREVFAGNS
jgi:riboflavin kinase/FMN adenylyltransferase